MFTSNITKDVKTSSGITITPGIHKAIFKGIIEEKVSSQLKQQDYNTFTAIFAVDGTIEYKYRLFEPTSNERVETQYGENPSQVEQFMLACRHFLDVMKPEASKAIDEGKYELKGANIGEITKEMGKLTKDFIGKEVELKFLPNKQGFANLSTFIGRISKEGNLYISNPFMGYNLTLSSYDIKAIENAKNARPTSMVKDKTNLLNDMQTDFGSDSGIDDLPF